MKIGDNVFCKKQRRYSSGINMNGKIYTIKNIIDNEIYITNEDNDDTVYYVIKDDSKHYYFYKYFLTVKEQRRLKIKKLNDNKTSDIL